MTILPARASEMETVRALFTEYSEWLDVDLGFQGFTDELRRLPGSYAPPSGEILLARLEDAVAGCVAVRSLASPTGDPDGGKCEMKRLWVRPAYRWKGIGRGLGLDIMRVARNLGYREMYLDTLAHMTGAISLYTSLGFRRTGPYYHNPLPGALYFKRSLTDAPTRTVEPGTSPW